MTVGSITPLERRPWVPSNELIALVAIVATIALILIAGRLGWYG